MEDIITLLSNPPSPCLVALILSYFCNKIFSLYIPVKKIWGMLTSILIGTLVYIYLQSPGNLPWELTINPMIVLIVYGVTISSAGVMVDEFKKKK